MLACSMPPLSAVCSGFCCDAFVVEVHANCRACCIHCTKVVRRELILRACTERVTKGVCGNGLIFCTQK